MVEIPHGAEIDLEVEALRLMVVVGMGKSGGEAVGQKMRRQGRVGFARRADLPAEGDIGRAQRVRDDLEFIDHAVPRLAPAQGLLPAQLAGIVRDKAEPEAGDSRERGGGAHGQDDPRPAAGEFDAVALDARRTRGDREVLGHHHARLERRPVRVPRGLFVGGHRDLDLGRIGGVLDGVVPARELEGLRGNRAAAGEDDLLLGELHPRHVQAVSRARVPVHQLGKRVAEIHVAGFHHGHGQRRSRLCRRGDQRGGCPHRQARARPPPGNREMPAVLPHEIPFIRNMLAPASARVESFMWRHYEAASRRSGRQPIRRTQEPSRADLDDLIKRFARGRIFIGKNLLRPGGNEGRS